MNNTFKGYQDFTKTTLLASLNQNITGALARISLWSASEFGEVVAAVIKGETDGHRDYDKKVDSKDVILEIGDCMWCISELCRLHGIALEDVAKKNIQKTYGRYLTQDFPDQDFGDNFSFAQYEALSQKTERSITPINGETEEQARLNIALLGIQKELGQYTAEITDYLIKQRTGDTAVLNTDILTERAGDTLWYCRLACSSVGYSLDDMIDLNREKLSRRYLSTPSVIE